MRIYFLSSRHCVLKINGVFAGYTDGFERFTELCPRDAPFCEIIPSDGEYLPVSFILDEKITAVPPRGVSLYVLPSALAVKADKFLRADFSLRLILHENLPFGELTIFVQGEPQAIFSDGEKTEVSVLGAGFEHCALHVFEHIFVLAGEKCIYAADKTGKAFFHGKTHAWRYDENEKEFILTAPLNDFCGRLATCAWNCATETPVPKRCDLSAPRDLPNDFILCRLMQELSFGTDASAFLSDELCGETETLKRFFGAYERVFPAPQFQFGAGATYKKRENVYETKYYAAETKNGKICNVQRKL